MNAQKQEHIRHAYYAENKSIRAIARETGHSRKTVSKAISCDEVQAYQLTAPRPAPVFGPYQARVEELLNLNEHLPRKNRYTVHTIFEILQQEGYQGCESRISQYRAEWNRHRYALNDPAPARFEPGQDAQCRWEEASVIVGGVQQTIQVFILQLAYSKRLFVMAFPWARPENFLYGHICAFKHFEGIPWRIRYHAPADVMLASKGKGRRAQQQFLAFRDHYHFEALFPPSEIQENRETAEGQVIQQHFFTPTPCAASFAELNLSLLRKHIRDDQLSGSGHHRTIGQAWQQEIPYLRNLPTFEYDCGVVLSARLTPYSQVIYETNRYSIPVNRNLRDVLIKAYPCHIEIYDHLIMLARHPRSYGREQDIFDPHHYLPLLEQGPRTSHFARTLKLHSEKWPESYQRMLSILRETWPEGRGVQEFIRVLQLHQDYSPQIMEVAIEKALSEGCVHFEGVTHCLQGFIALQRSPTKADFSG